MDFLLVIHSWVRWLIVLVAVIAVVKFAIGIARRSDYDRMSTGLMAGFSGLMDLQALLGIAFLLAAGLTGAGFPAYRIEHAVTPRRAAASSRTGARPGRFLPASSRARSSNRSRTGSISSAPGRT